jgi:hypothetical protein
MSFLSPVRYQGYSLASWPDARQLPDRHAKFHVVARLGLAREITSADDIGPVFLESAGQHGVAEVQVVQERDEVPAWVYGTAGSSGPEAPNPRQS